MSMYGNFTEPPEAPLNQPESSVVDCPECGGSGELDIIDDHAYRLLGSYDCPRCEGRGFISKEEADGK